MTTSEYLRVITKRMISTHIRHNKWNTSYWARSELVSDGAGKWSREEDNDHRTQTTADNVVGAKYTHTNGGPRHVCTVVMQDDTSHHSPQLRARQNKLLTATCATMEHKTLCNSCYTKQISTTFMPRWTLYSNPLQQHMTKFECVNLCYYAFSIRHSLQLVKLHNISSSAARVRLNTLYSITNAKLNTLQSANFTV